MPDSADTPLAHHKDDAIQFSDVLLEELKEIQKLRRKRGVDYPSAVLTSSKPETVFGYAHELKLTGLAFSGGGIRSATFNLGVLQGLAEYRLLTKFDYLSTVSGGGYIGSWLEAWILREGQKRNGFKKENGSVYCPEEEVTPGIRLVEAQLNPDRALRESKMKELEKEPAPERKGEPASEEKSRPEPKPIRFLREYSNYLTPRLGILGADTWTMVAIYLRNLLLNQAILTLFLFFLLLLPYVAVGITEWCSTWDCLEKYYAAPVLVFLLNTGGLWLGARNLKYLAECNAPDEQKKRWCSNPPQGTIVGFSGLAHFLSAWILTAWIWNHPEFWTAENSWKWWMLGGFIGLSFPWIICCFFAPETPEAASYEKEQKIPWSLRHPRTAWGIASVGMGVAGGLIFYTVADEVFARLRRGDGAHWHEMALGVPLVLMVMLLCAALQIGLMGRSFVDPYREWYSRLAGWLFILTIVWAVGFGVAIYAPLGLMWLRGWLAAVGIGWLASTAFGVLGAKSSKTGTPDSKTVKDALLSVTPLIFIAGLVSLLSLCLELILARLNWASKWPDVQAAWCHFLAKSPGVAKVANWVLTLDGTFSTPGGMLNTPAIAAYGTAAQATPSHITPVYIAAHWQLLDASLNCRLLVWLAIAFAACFLLSWRVDLNEFSMNLFYRNRLVRCYLGATREDRAPNIFTGFDSCDDLCLTELQPEHCYSGPFPIFNATLNLVSGRDLAWQERKAESFPMTPLRSGYDVWLESLDLPPEEKHDGMQRYAFRPTRRFMYADGGPFVGTTVSVSGAAASPNMGYHSNPPLAMLMTFFNVRLGWWVGNPRNDNTWFRPGPRVGLWQLLCELFGLTNDDSDYVYLSDGGHFENLGIYELLKRRCKYVVACDAGADPKYSLDDLGNAIRKCREDIGVEIELNTKPVVLTADSDSSSGSGDKSSGNNPRASCKKWSKWHCVVGEIRYDMVDLPSPKKKGEKEESDAERRKDMNGVFVYLKASLTGEEPGDVLNYQSSNQEFPHQSTLDQWFSESQFESYRRLGQHIVEAMLDPLAEDPTGRQPTLHEDAQQLVPTLSTRDLFHRLATRWSPPPEPLGGNPPIPPPRPRRNPRNA